MPRPGNLKDHGALLDIQPSIHGQEVSTDTSVNGDSVDGTDALSLVALCNVGAEANADNTYDFTFKVQESADGSTGWADLDGASVDADSDTPDQLLEIRANLEVGLGHYRVVATSTNTGGTSVAIVVSAHIILAGLREGVPTSA